MERKYSTGTIDNAKFFVGDEIEHTPAYGKKTLFVVGLQNIDEILSMCNKYRCDHIYMGANQSFRATDSNDLEKWEKLLIGLLKENLWVTLDLDVKDVILCSDLLTWCCEYNKFIPMISVKVPYISNLNYNTCIKIDDKDFNFSNPGVWVHDLHDLMNKKKFTDWSKYENDVIIQYEEKIDG